MHSQAYAYAKLPGKPLLLSKIFVPEIGVRAVLLVKLPAPLSSLHQYMEYGKICLPGLASALVMVLIAERTAAGADTETGKDWRETAAARHGALARTMAVAPRSPRLVDSFVVAPAAVMRSAA